MLSTFWKLYEREHPSHTVFQLQAMQVLQLHQTIPVVLHGDGGRTAKKQPLEVFSLIPVLGLDSKEAKFSCKCPGSQTYGGHDFGDPMVQRMNSKNNSYLTHFLLMALPTKRYRTTPGLLNEMLRIISNDLSACCTTGLLTKTGERWHIALIGMRGDAEWHSKIGFLSRSYQNVGHRNFIACCHQCKAGEQAYPFEDFRTSAAWKQTLYEDPPPWSVVPPFGALPFDDGGWDSGGAARFFRGDMFHVFRLGICRNFLGSAIILMCLDGYFDSPNDPKDLKSQLQRAWGSFSLWLATNKLSVQGLRSFSREKLHFPTATSFPYIGCKGSDTMTILKWVKFFASLNGQRIIVEGASHGIKMQAFHGHGLWLRPDCRRVIMQSIKGFLRCYAKLAQGAHRRNLTLFGMVPKAHALDHVAHELALMESEPFSLNPGTFDCSMSEDFIGKISKQSRRISFKNVVENTLLAYKVKAHLTIRRFKEQRHP
eukprot:Skav217612  [mRNA]  locus=scaffold2172:275333:276781:- [translate_table: standard]